MSLLVDRFSGFVPTSEFAHRIVGPSRSMLSDEHLEIARRDRLSFRHSVGRGASVTHEEAVEWLRHCQSIGALAQVGPSVLVHRMRTATMVATGLVAEVALAAYGAGGIKPHESTIAKTERRMADYMRRTRIYGNPVVLAHRPRPGIDRAIAAGTATEPDATFATADGAHHSLWSMDEVASADACVMLEDPLYVIDGHHRLAAAAQIAAEEGRADARLPAGIFSSDELRLRSYARCITDPVLDPEQVVERVATTHHVELLSGDDLRPQGPGVFTLSVGHDHYAVELRSDMPVGGSFDVDELQRLVLEPLFGIEDPRRDSRLRFVADLPEAPLSSHGATAAFLPYPATVEDVLDTADRGHTMPPKSTWFAPKVPSGLAIRLRDQR